MSMGRIEIEEQPGVYVSGTRARWLLQGRRANLTSSGKLHLLSAGTGATHAKEPRQDRTQWSGYSSSGARNYSGTHWLAGFHMNGDAINHG
ncbi:MAG TPA: hypothetical protein VIC54_11355 [Terriglobales bacterium]